MSDIILKAFVHTTWCPIEIYSTNMTAYATESFIAVVLMFDTIGID